MPSTPSSLPQESDLFELLIFAWKSRWSIFWGLCVGIVLAFVLTGIKQRRSAGIVYQVKIAESLDPIYGLAPTGEFVIDLLQDSRWKTLFYTKLLDEVPPDQQPIIRKLLEEIIARDSVYGLSKNATSNQGPIYSVRWPDEYYARFY